MGCRGLKLTVEYCPGYGTHERRWFQPTGIGPAQPPLGLFFTIPVLIIPEIPPSGFHLLPCCLNHGRHFFFIKNSFQFCLQTSLLCLETLGLFQSFRFSTGRLVPIITERNSGTQEIIRLFTQRGLLAGQEFTGRLLGSSLSYPLLYPVAFR